jgi:hypothetical protein
LLFRDGDGGLESFIRGSGFAGIDLQQNFAPQAVEKSEVTSIFDLIRE